MLDDDEYTTRTSQRGKETFLFRKGRAIAMYVGPDHVEEATRAAERANEDAVDRWLLEPGEKFPP